MSTEGRRFRHVSSKSGAFVLAAAVVVIAVLLLTARAQWWFAHTRSFAVHLPAEGSFGLRAGSAVELLGTTAGYVNELHIDADGAMSATISVSLDFARFVCADSICTIRKKTLDLAGDAYLEIARGSGAQLAEGAWLSCSADRGLAASLSAMVLEIGGELRPALAEVRGAAKECAAVARLLRDPDGPVLRLIADLDALSRQLQSGPGVAARLISDPQLATDAEAALRSLHDALEQANATALRIGDSAVATSGRVDQLLARLSQGDGSITAALGDLRTLLAELRPIVADLGHAVAALPEITSTARAEARSLPGIVLRSQAMLAELEKVVQAAQRHWLLRSYVEPAPATARVGGEGIGAAK